MTILINVFIAVVFLALLIALFLALRSRQYWKDAHNRTVKMWKAGNDLAEKLANRR